MIRAALLALMALVLLPTAASAHPLGNFSVNHLSRVSVSSDRVDVRYLLDEVGLIEYRGGAPPADTGRLRSLDVVEINPALDVRNRTAELAVEFVQSLFGASTLVR